MFFQAQPGEKSDTKQSGCGAVWDARGYIRILKFVISNAEKRQISWCKPRKKSEFCDEQLENRPFYEYVTSWQSMKTES